MSAQKIAMGLGAASLLLILGALGFQYIGHMAPCEICHWQRWPHIAAAMIGLGGGALVAVGAVKTKYAPLLALSALLLVALSGGIGVYHAGVEWHLWQGPSACTAARFVFAPGENLNDETVVRCDAAAFRFFGISLAGYNALISFGLAALGAWLLARRKT